jgi:hypothetical protein
MRNFASDAIEDAQRIAKVNAFNSKTYSEILSYLNLAWKTIYQRIVMIDSGFYAKTIRLTDKQTRLPPFVKNVVRVYAAPQANMFNREPFREAGQTDMLSRNTFFVSGFDIYCPEARVRSVWCEYVPVEEHLSYTLHNRDPKILEAYTPPVHWDANNKQKYGHYTLDYVPAAGTAAAKYYLTSRIDHNKRMDITEMFNMSNDMESGDSIRYDAIPSSIICDFPYIFVTYYNAVVDECVSGYYIDVLNDHAFNMYNPFEFTGRASNVEYIAASFNDKTGMGVVVKDHDDNNRYKEMGFTNDSLIQYPSSECFDLLVAMLANEFAAGNESTVMQAANRLVEAKYNFEAFLEKNKASWKRITNINTQSFGDLL